MKNTTMRSTLYKVLVVCGVFLMDVPPEYIGMVGCWATDYLRKLKKKQHAK